MDMEELGAEPLHFVPSDPVVIELNRLQNQLKDKDRELGVAHAEIKALKVTELLKDKAVEECTDELKKLDEKLQSTENLLEQKNLEVKKLINEKKEALAAQFAAEAALRRIHATQKDEDFLPLEAFIAPLEADIKMYKNEIAMLHEDNKALERLTKSKEAALVEAEKILRSAMERALIVEEIQNQNFELKRQIEIFQEENKILDKTNRQKVLEVEKLSQTIRELEESILAGGAAANCVRDYQRLISELNEEKRTLERELARVKVSANRVATVVANEWKDDNDKVMPVKQWLEERKFFQGEIQRLKEKLTVSERTAKAEAQLKDKLRLRLKTLEEGLKHVASFSSNPISSSGSHETEKPEHVLGFLSNKTGPRKRSSSQPRASISKTSVLQQPNVGVETANSPGQFKQLSSLKTKFGTGENMFKRNLWASKSKFMDDGGKENSESDVNIYTNSDSFSPEEMPMSDETEVNVIGELGVQNKSNMDSRNEDLVSGFLYDRIQREVISLRKFCQEKDGILNAKEHEIKMLQRKSDGLTKAMEIEAKKMKREAAAREKDALLAKSNDNKQKNRNTNVLKRSVQGSAR
ncbi:microtubule-associated protein 70-5-like [Aristolochia californica]|uniref:microtubule-associated protein 70-5-like n=1 Tax=Aristolochia californica TaxID=171875 RepID=UPI0035E122FC